jgi:hypothetical protein
MSWKSRPLTAPRPSGEREGVPQAQALKREVSETDDPRRAIDDTVLRSSPRQLAEAIRDVGGCAKE